MKYFTDESYKEILINLLKDYDDYYYQLNIDYDAFTDAEEAWVALNEFGWGKAITIVDEYNEINGFALDNPKDTVAFANYLFKILGERFILDNLYEELLIVWEKQATPEINQALVKVLNKKLKSV